jgi:hypothetical protein
MPPMTTTTVEAPAVETGMVEATTKEATMKAPAMETPEQTTVMKEPKPDPDRYRSAAVGVIRQ